MKIGIFGGNGFVGSAIARKAVARGWNVVSFSRSGTPFATPAGHTPAWAEEVEWKRASVFDPRTYEADLASCDALVSTLGILLETDYKVQGQARPLSVLRAIAENATGSRGNPLARQTDRSYERINRDSALTLYDTFHASRSGARAEASPFVYISAEDIFRPFVPQRYISTKRAAEAEIWKRSNADPSRRSIRPILMRPSLMYHPHLAPSSTLPATLLEATSTLHNLVPKSLHMLPSTHADRVPSETVPPAYQSLAALMSVPPIHVDAVGAAACQAIDSPSVDGVVDVARMRLMLGFDRTDSRTASEGPL
ncbi:hypothetical protein JCM8115_001189 [Rhodotorula mucilaginosa]|uniref:NAD-dependent epimerase/dehydratase domain-containing protein n=1 Tax=Rhodotorula mucilaginosa TaxID=5537 RepID=A0A9P6VVZ4_RHOMI|nr:hypothetical protein C6P46_000831 [Rhodotorula mucilaginosa]